jgi:hypothetical protein
MADDEEMKPAKKKPGLAEVVLDAEPEEGSDEEEGGEGFSEAAKEVFDAITANDVEGFKQALKACVLSVK